MHLVIYFDSSFAFIWQILLVGERTEISPDNLVKLISSKKANLKHICTYICWESFSIVKRDLFLSSYRHSLHLNSWQLLKARCLACTRVVHGGRPWTKGSCRGLNAHDALERLQWLWIIVSALGIPMQKMFGSFWNKRDLAVRIFCSKECNPYGGGKIWDGTAIVTHCFSQKLLGIVVGQMHNFSWSLTNTKIGKTLTMMSFRRGGKKGFSWRGFSLIHGQLSPYFPNRDLVSLQFS